MYFCTSCSFLCVAFSICVPSKVFFFSTLHTFDQVKIKWTLPAKTRWGRLKARQWSGTFGRLPRSESASPTVSSVCHLFIPSTLSTFPPHAPRLPCSQSPPTAPTGSWAPTTPACPSSTPAPTSSASSTSTTPGSWAARASCPTRPCGTPRSCWWAKASTCSGWRPPTRRAARTTRGPPRGIISQRQDDQGPGAFETLQSVIVMFRGWNRIPSLLLILMISVDFNHLQCVSLAWFVPWFWGVLKGHTLQYIFEESSFSCYLSIYVSIYPGVVITRSYFVHWQFVAGCRVCLCWRAPSSSSPSFLLFLHLSSPSLRRSQRLHHQSAKPPGPFTGNNLVSRLLVSLTDSSHSCIRVYERGAWQDLACLFLFRGTRWSCWSWSVFSSAWLPFTWLVKYCFIRPKNNKVYSQGK